MKKILTVNFGCRVNSAELNQLTQKYINDGFTPLVKEGQGRLSPDLIVINTCAVTKKGEYESISKIKDLQQKFPQAKIFATGCADLSKLKNVKIISKNNLPAFYTPQVKDKFSHTNRYLLRIQTGCTAFCSYCIVPYRRPHLWSLPINEAISIVNHIPTYQEIIITGVNLNQYTPSLSNLLEALLIQTKIPLISFGSVPLLCIDKNFINLYEKYSDRLSHFLHIPIQSGSDKILKLMNRPYNVKKTKEIFSLLKTPFFQGGVPDLPAGRHGGRGGLNFGTDIIVGFPTETDSDFQQTYNLCQQLGFSKLHVFRFSPRPNTPALKLFKDSPKISNLEKISRSQKLRSLISQTTLPFHQTPGT
ncbi:MAG: radical SAM protein [Candidatus Shapirobacteria bacterium]|nr:radical SAM protein [Candidatus Shapirobacteria bacterium]